MKAISIFLLVSSASYFVTAQQNSPWTYICEENRVCRRTLAAGTTGGKPLNVCKLNCDPNKGSLFPLPSGAFTIGSALTGFYPQNVKIAGVGVFPNPVRELFGNASEIFHGYLSRLQPNPPAPVPPFNETHISIVVSITNTALSVLTLETDESYNLTVSTADNKTVNIKIDAITFYGARHGLETLSQLLAYDENNDVLQIVNTASITNDKPAYKYRGISLDTSRNFISLAGLKRLVDGMSFNKLNMLHWHITDTHSFPMEVAGNPNFTLYGAYDARSVYSMADMADLVAYARPRGVKIVPEFDQPAHMGFGWDWGPTAGKGNLVVCLNSQPWYDYCVEPPCGQINIANQEIYPVLETIYTSMFSIFDKDLFHMGGDEVHNGCYNSSQEITDYMATKGYNSSTAEGFIQLWGEFQLKSHESVKTVSGNPQIKTIMWTSELTDKAHVVEHLPPSEYYIQIWTDANSQAIPDLIGLEYKVIFSNYDVMYLDCGFQAWIGGPNHNWCSPYHTWQQIYNNDPIAIYANLVNDTQLAENAYNNGLLLGSETPLWTEQADELSFETRIWPRAAAHAERMWTNPREAGWAEAEFRMVTNRQRMVDRGVTVDRLQPQFCSQYQDHCYGYPEASEPEVTTPPPNNGNLNGATQVFLLLGLSLTFFVTYYY